MVTMSREPIEKSCSSKQFQYSQETIKTLQNIMREVASKMERPNISNHKTSQTYWLEHIHKAQVIGEYVTA